MCVFPDDTTKKRKTNADYALDLLSRKLKVACPHCGSGVGEYCKGAYGRPTVGCHWARSRAAREAGYLSKGKGIQ